jgi:hypothetical protein
VLKLPDLNPPEEDFDELELLELLELPELLLLELELPELLLLELELELPGIDFGVLKLPDLNPLDEDLELIELLEDFELLNPLDLKLLELVRGFAYTVLLNAPGVSISTETNRKANIRLNKSCFFFLISFTPREELIHILIILLIG